MPIIYTYPSTAPALDDTIIFSDTSETNPAKATRQCTFTQVKALVGSASGTVASVATTNSIGASSGVSFAAAPNPIVTTGTITLGFSGVIGDILYADTATSLNKLTAGTLNHVLTSGGPGVAPLWAANPSAPVTSVSGIAAGTSSGTVTVVTPTTGLVTIQPMAYAGTTNVGHVPTGGSASTFLRGDATWVTPTDTTYSKATDAALGLVKLEDVAVQTTAANAITTTASRSYGVQFNASDQLVVNVPWTTLTQAVGFTPMDMYEATGETGVGGKRIFVQTVSPTTFTANKVKIFIHQTAATPTFTVGIYDGKLGAGIALLGQGSVSPVTTGIHVITLTPTNPGDLDLTAGKDYVIAYDQTATNSSCAGSSTALSNAELATTIATSAALVDPLSMEGMAATGLRVAMTIW